MAIAFSDITRPTPSHIMLPAILDVLAGVGVRRENVALVNGTGMHRPNTREELIGMLGQEIVDGYRIVQHDAKDRSQHAFVGRNERGAEIWVNRDYLEANVRILTGFVEPHIFAGYSGGGKALLPGIAGADIIMSNHGGPMLAHPKATWCQTKGNPVFEEMREVALATRPTFLLNVTLNERKEITGVFAGDLVRAHDAGIAFAEKAYLRRVPQRYDIALSTNMGYPADINLYQSIKGMSVAAQGVREGGRRGARRRVRRGHGPASLRGDGHLAEVGPGAAGDGAGPRLRGTGAVGHPVPDHGAGQGRRLPALDHDPRRRRSAPT